ncbi:MAG TPA: hypothetical protein DHU96_35260 [Actinobacteria bacterium]|nr:hypothetical protein [Actinomycetota bacterium]
MAVAGNGLPDSRAQAHSGGGVDGNRRAPGGPPAGLRATGLTAALHGNRGCLKEKITSGGLLPGEQIPPVPQLSETYRVSRNTALRTPAAQRRRPHQDRAGLGRVRRRAPLSPGPRSPNQDSTTWRRPMSPTESRWPAARTALRSAATLS